MVFEPVCRIVSRHNKFNALFFEHFSRGQLCFGEKRVRTLADIVRTFRIERVVNSEKFGELHMCPLIERIARGSFERLRVSSEPFFL